MMVKIVWVEKTDNPAAWRGWAVFLCKGKGTKRYMINKEPSEEELKEYLDSSPGYCIRR